jgi:hypothetical protein
MLFTVTDLARGRCDLCRKSGDVLKTGCRRSAKEACELWFCGRCFGRAVKAAFNPIYRKFVEELESRLPPEGPRLSAEYIAEVLIRRPPASPDKRVLVIKELRELTGLGLKDTKDAVDAAWARVPAARLGVVERVTSA